MVASAEEMVQHHLGHAAWSSSWCYSSSISSHSHHFDYSAIMCYLRFTMPLAVKPFLIEKIDMGSFNMHNNLSACHAHRGETGTHESAKVLTRKN